MLGKPERHREQGVKQAEHGAGGGGEKEPQPQVAALEDRDPGDEGAKAHDALDAEVDNAGALADQVAEGAEDQRRGDAQGGGPEAGARQQAEGFPEPGHRQRGL